MVHHITNSVVTNLTANVTLCFGAQPVMAPCIDESPEMVRFAGALLLNIGTLDPPLVESMLAAGRSAAEQGVPILLDPVGAGATGLRTEAAARLMDELPVSVVRGNAGELLALAGAGGAVRGVDSMDTVEGKLEAISAYAAGRGVTIAVTGPSDYVTDGSRTTRVDNGHPMMGMVTGTGCSASTAVACYMAAVEDPVEAAVGALVAYGIAGEAAAEGAAGPGSFVPRLLDAIHRLDSGVIGGRARAEELS